MKIHFPCFKKVVALIWLAGGLASPGFAQSNPRAAEVTRISGKARFSTDHHTWQTLKDGVALMSGALIQTADGSKLTLRLGEKEAGSRIELSGGSVLSIDRLASETSGATIADDTELTLRTGEISGHLGKSDHASKYEINLPNGIVGVRSGDYRLVSTGLLSITSGDAVIVLSKPDNSPAVVVKAGHRFDPTTGALTEIPVADSPEKPDAEHIVPAAMPHPAGMGASIRHF
jgi:hypothetical protein